MFAETSLTIEGIETVIDSGLSKRSIYDPNSGMARLVTKKYLNQKPINEWVEREDCIRDLLQIMVKGRMVVSQIFLHLKLKIQI